MIAIETNYLKQKVKVILQFLLRNFPFSVRIVLCTLALARDSGSCRPPISADTRSRKSGRRTRRQAGTQSCSALDNLVVWKEDL